MVFISGMSVEFATVSEYVLDFPIIDKAAKAIIKIDRECVRNR